MHRLLPWWPPFPSRKAICAALIFVSVFIPLIPFGGVESSRIFLESCFINLSILFTCWGIFFLFFVKYRPDEISFTIADLIVFFWLSVNIFQFSIAESCSFQGRVQSQIILTIFYVCCRIFAVRFDNGGWQFYRISIATLIWCVFYSVINVAQQLWYYSAIIEPIDGPFNNSGIFACYLSCNLLLVAAGLVSKKIKSGYLASLVIIGTIVLLLTQSRAGIISALVAMTFMLWKVVPANKSKALERLFFVIALMSITILALLFRSKINSFKGRELIYKLSLELGLNTPLWGFGYNSFESQFSKLQIRYFSSGQGNDMERMLADSIHFAFNEYLQLYIEFGPVTFSVLAGSIIFLIVLTTRKKPELAPSLMAVGVFALFSYPFHSPPINQMLILILCYATISLKPFSVSFKPMVPVILMTLFCLTVNNILRTWYGTKWMQANMESVNGNIASALNIYRSIYPVLEDHVPFTLDYGIALHDNGSHRESSVLLQKCIKHSAYIQAYSYEADNRYKLQDRGAESYYLAAVNLIPSRLFPKYDLMRFYINTGRKNEAEKMAYVILNTRIKIPTIEANAIKSEASNLISKQSYN